MKPYLLMYVLVSVINISWFLFLNLIPLNVVGQIPPMPIEFENSAEFRWLNKEIIDSRLLDDMSDLDNWSFRGTGKLTFEKNRGPNDINVLRVDMEMFYDVPAPTSRELSAVNLRRDFSGEDWSDYNRISMYIRPEVKGFPMLPLQIVLHNDGEVKIPDEYYREGIHYVTLESDKWQKVVWEITPFARDKVTSLELGYWVNKMLADPGDRVAFEIGKIELQRVEPDQFKGWDVAPGRISYSHTGYQTGSSKRAFASDLTAEDFHLIRLNDNVMPEVLLTKSIENVKTRLGEFQIMDFSEVQEPGEYILQAGNTCTRPFGIDANIWRGTIWKALNFFHCQRCGYKVPGYHDVCHRDWMATHGDKKIPLNGGWHDAGDLSQGTVNTGEATYAMFALAERLQAREEDLELLDAVLIEAKWGLDWLLRVRFDGGYRVSFAGNNLWTDGIIGTVDDRSSMVYNNPNANYITAAALALAYRVLKESDPELASRSLSIAKDDWLHAIDGIEGPDSWSTPAFAVTPIELAGIGILASLELYKSTGKSKYSEKAIELGEIIVGSQQKSYIGTEFPLAGFFYTCPDKQAHFHQFHHGNDQSFILGLTKLATAFPNHEDWMKWYSVVALYSEYQKTISQITEPYSVLPAYVYRETDYIHIPEQAARHQATREGFREQVQQGFYMGDGYYLRAFPVWFARRGNYGVLLSQAKALAVAAHLRRDLDGAELAQKQAQWIVGRNPFAQSTMYGEGYDWSQQYSVSSGDIVGSLPVGMTSFGITDIPYWPRSNMYVYKEVWVHSTSRWLWLMQELAGPSLVEGIIEPGSSGKVNFIEKTTGRILSVNAENNGKFRLFIPEGKYKVRSDNQQTRLIALPGGSYYLDLRDSYTLDLFIEAETKDDGEVTIKLNAKGEGTHSFEIRTENLNIDQTKRKITLSSCNLEIIEWNAEIQSTDKPWVAVIVPNNNIERRMEVIGFLNLGM